MKITETGNKWWLIAAVLAMAAIGAFIIDPGITPASTPLTTESLNQLALDAHVIYFPNGMIGRKVEGKEKIAVETQLFQLEAYPDSLFTYDDLDRMGQAGKIDESTHVETRIRRALVTGDSTLVAGLLETKRVAWYDVGPDEPDPSVQIMPPTTCPLAAAQDSTR